MKIGFTGTRDGMTIRQRLTVHKLLLEHSPAHVLHGDCIGADEDFDELCKQIPKRPLFEVFPAQGVLPSLRAKCHLRDTSYGCSYNIRPSAPPLDRNRTIVEGCDLLIATPKQYIEQVRSGTWATIRYAKQRKKPLIIVWQDGTTSLT